MPENQGKTPSFPLTSCPEPAGQQTQVPNDEFPVLLPLFLHLNAQTNQTGIIPFHRGVPMLGLRSNYLAPQPCDTILQPRFCPVSPLHQAGNTRRG